MKRIRKPLFTFAFGLTFAATCTSALGLGTLAYNNSTQDLSLEYSLDDPALVVVFARDGSNTNITSNVLMNSFAPCSVTLPPPSGTGQCPYVSGDSWNVTLTNQDDLFRTQSNDPAKAKINGLDGADLIITGAANDLLNGGQGNDALQGLGGNDTFIGGSGDLDFVSYTYSSSPITATLDGSATSGDQAAAEHDLIATDVEGILGGTSNDLLTGNGDANVLDGEEGNDTLLGGDGNDTLIAGAESETTANTLNGGDGDDTINALTAAVDSITCGPGNDSVRANIHDQIAADCETVNGSPNVPSPPVPTTTTTSPSSPPIAQTTTPPVAPPRTTIALLAKSARVKKGSLQFKASCVSSASGVCSGRLQLKAKLRGKNVVVGSAQVSVRSGGAKTITVKLNRQAKRALKRGRLKIAATLSITDSNGTQTSSKTTLTARR